MHCLIVALLITPICGPASVAVLLPEPVDQPADPAPEDPAPGEPWASLADCESGNWVNGGETFEPGSARWDWGAPDADLPPWGTDIHHGGLQHHPDTWTWVAGDLGLTGDYPHAYDAPPHVQIEVAEEVLARQGWGAWPTCSEMLGLR